MNKARFDNKKLDATAARHYSSYLQTKLSVESLEKELARAAPFHQAAVTEVARAKAAYAAAMRKGKKVKVSEKHAVREAMEIAAAKVKKLDDDLKLQQQRMQSLLDFRDQCKRQVSCAFT